MKATLLLVVAITLAAGSALAGKSTCPYQSKSRMKSSDFSWALPGGKPQINKQTPAKKGLREASHQSVHSSKNG